MPKPDRTPPMIRTDHSNAFANHTMRVRLPEIIRKVRDMNPDYPASIQHNLDALGDSLENDAPIPMLNLPAPDYDAWATAHAAHEQDTWLNTDWFFAETFAYRHIIQAVRWWETNRDPFAPIKNDEQASDAVKHLIELALSITGPAEERLAKLIDQALWANRIDLSIPALLEHGTSVSAEDLLVNDREQVVQHLFSSPGPVHIVADNVGRELAMDLVLSDALLNGITDTVFLHLKMHPTFVSDATVSDVLRFIYDMERGLYGPAASKLGQRLHEATDRGQLRFAPDLFWNSSRLLRDLPPGLTHLFRQAKLVIFKGDLNYRRLVGDAIWVLTTPLTQVADFFPAPLLTLRTLKSDPIAGLPPGLVEQLNRIDQNWRFNGKRGLIQSTLS